MDKSQRLLYSGWKKSAASCGATSRLTPARPLPPKKRKLGHFHSLFGGALPSRRRSPPPPPRRPQRRFLQTFTFLANGRWKEALGLREANAPPSFSTMTFSVWPTVQRQTPLGISHTGRCNLNPEATLKPGRSHVFEERPLNSFV